MTCGIRVRAFGGRTIASWVSYLGACSDQSSLRTACVATRYGELEWEIFCLSLLPSQDGASTFIASNLDLM